MSPRIRETWPPPSLVSELVREIGAHQSSVALVLGSGLGSLADRLDPVWSRAAADIPGYPESRVAGHLGRLHLGRLDGHLVWVVQGRVHLYEGHPVEHVTRYVRLLHALGVRTLVLTNAAGSVDPMVAPGDVLVASDAFGLFFRALARPGGASARDGSLPAGAEALWRRRSVASDPQLVRLAEETARGEGIALRKGTLIGSLGPNYETAAEVRVWRQLGGTVASMSTVPEAVQARELGMRCLLFSLVTNFGTGLSAEVLTHADVVAVAGRAGAQLETLLRKLLPRL